MTARDLRWRMAGIAMTAGGCAAGLLDRSGSPLVILYFVLAVLGNVLMLNGKRIATMWRAERTGHQETAAAVHAGRVRRRRREGAEEAGR